MDPSSSVGKTWLGENIIEISSDKGEGHGDWNSYEFQDTTTMEERKKQRLWNETATIYPELNLLLVSSKEEGKISDDWDLLLDNHDFGDIPDIDGVNVSQFVCMMGK
nr:hypothetical protein [Tanacetum cinerariifolium]